MLEDRTLCYWAKASGHPQCTVLCSLGHTCCLAYCGSTWPALICLQLWSECMPAASAVHRHAPVSCSPFCACPACLRRVELAQVRNKTFSVLSQDISTACPQSTAQSQGCLALLAPILAHFHGLQPCQLSLWCLDRFVFCSCTRAHATAVSFLVSIYSGPH